MGRDFDTWKGNEGKISKDSVAKAICTNEYKAPKGDLTVRKSVKGKGKDSKEKFKFDIHVDGAEGKYSAEGACTEVTFDENGDATVELTANSYVTIKNLPDGAAFEVNEDEASLPEDWKVIGWKDDKNSGEIKEGEAVELICENEYLPKGSLKVEKKISGEGSEANNGEFSFEIFVEGAKGEYPAEGKYDKVTFGEDGKVTLSLMGGESVTIKDLPDGAEYKVEEIFPLPDHWSFDRWKDNEGKISKDAVAKAICTNEYKTPKGDLTVKKSVEGSGSDSDEKFKFYIHVDGAEGKYKAAGACTEVTFDENGDTTVELTPNTFVTIKDLPNEAAFEVNEEEQLPKYWEFVGWKDDKNSGTIEDGTEVVLICTNEYKPKGSLTVQKLITGEGATANNKEFKFEIFVDGAKGEYEAEGRYENVKFDDDGKVELTLKGGEHVTIKNLPDKAAYEVKETGMPKDWEFLGWKDGSNKGVIAKDTAAEAICTNEYKPPKGSLKLEKKVSGNIDTDQEFEFKVEVEGDVNGNFGGVEFRNGKAVVKLKAGESVTMIGLPAGAKYSVEENVPKDWEIKEKVGYEGRIPEGGVAEAAVATFTNKHILRFEVDKKWVSADGTEKAWPKGKSADITVKYGNDTQTVKLSASNPSANFEYEEIKGAKFEVTETTVNGYEPGKISTKGNKVTVTNKEIPPEIVSTTAIAANVPATKQSAATIFVPYGEMIDISVADQVQLKNMHADKDYTIVSTLWKDCKDEVQKKTVVLSGVDGDGFEKVEFDDPITKVGRYDVKTAIYEGKEPEELKLIDTHNDKLNVASERIRVAQGVPGKIRTTVTADGKTADPNNAVPLEPNADGTITTEVIDAVDYEDLHPNTMYKVTGTLNEVSKGEVVKTLATVTEELKTSESGSGHWEFF